MDQINLRDVLVERYGLLSEKSWNIDARDEDLGLVLLSGYYAGNIYSFHSGEDFDIPYEPRQSWQIRRLERPLLGYSDMERINVPNLAGSSSNDWSGRQDPRLGGRFVRFQPYRLGSSYLPLEEERRLPKDAKIYPLPSGVIVRLWSYNGQTMISTRNKIHDSSLSSYFEEITPDLDLVQYYLIVDPSLTTTSGKYVLGKHNLRGVFALSSELESKIDLPEIIIEEANEWMGFNHEPWQLSGGESIIVFNGQQTIICKPISQVWRETVIYGDVFPDNYLLGMPNKRTEEQLQKRFFELMTTRSMPKDVYYRNYPQIVSGGMNDSLEIMANTDAVFKQLLNGSNRNFYQEFFGVGPNQSFIFGKGLLGEISRWLRKRFEDGETLPQLQKRIKTIALNAPGDPWERLDQLLYWDISPLDYEPLLRAYSLSDGI